MIPESIYMELFDGSFFHSNVRNTGYAWIIKWSPDLKFRTHQYAEPEIPEKNNGLD